MSRLVKLEKMLEHGLDRLRHPETDPELVEAIPDVLDDVEDHIAPSGGRGRVFPYDRILVSFYAPGANRAAARALARDLGARIRERLRSRGCEPPPDLEIRVGRVEAPGADWGGRWFRVRYRRAAAPSDATPAPKVPEAPPAIRFTILRGRAGVKEITLALARIHLGRLEKVASASGRGSRKNHVWFAASEDTVSRAHARIERAGGDYLLFDEGSASGTRVLREGEEIDLIPRASRGVRLRNGDHIELGKGCVVQVGMTEVQ